jgi:hypothetical protein
MVACWMSLPTIPSMHKEQENKPKSHMPSQIVKTGPLPRRKEGSRVQRSLPASAARWRTVTDPPTV